MVVAKSIEEYRQIQQRRIDAIKAAGENGPIVAATYLAARLRQLCPRGIRAHPSYVRMYQTIQRSKGSVSMGGTNPNTGFAYIHWVNNTPGFELTSWGKTYAQARNKTGEPGFYWIAQDEALHYSTDVVRQATQKALSSSF